MVNINTINKKDKYNRYVMKYIYTHYNIWYNQYIGEDINGHHNFIVHIENVKTKKDIKIMYSMGTRKNDYEYPKLHDVLFGMALDIQLYFHIPYLYENDTQIKRLQKISRRIERSLNKLLDIPLNEFLVMYDCIKYDI